MSKRSRLLKSVAETIADYRKGEIPPPTPDHVDTWIKQFAKAVQEPILTEVDHVLKQVYISKGTVRKFLSNLVTNNNLAGDDPCSYWEDVGFLDIQGGGNSQREMLKMFDKALQKECGLTIEDCGDDPETCIYLDDGIFSGNRVRNDLIAWINSNAPLKVRIHVVVMALHRGGRYYASTSITRAARTAEKEIDTKWWRSVEIEDRKAYINASEVLRPASLPDDKLTKAYVKMLKDSGYPPVLRKAGKMGNSVIFSSEAGRDLLEQQFLQAGLQIKEMCPYLSENHRPLGYTVLKTLGFGSLIVTFRNCPNNCPLAFWVDDPWYPLFPRKTN